MRRIYIIINSRKIPFVEKQVFYDILFPMRENANTHIGRVKMLTERDLQELEQAARFIVNVIERHRIHEENALDKRSAFRIVENTEFGKILPFPGNFKEVKTESSDAETSVFEANAKSGTMILKFTEKEISKMSYSFKKVFIANGLAAHVIKRESGKTSFCYEIRYRSNGYNISASSTDLRKAKEKFVAKTIPEEIEKYRTEKKKGLSELFSDIFDEWYMVKQGTITEKALKRFQSIFDDLPEELKRKSIKSIRTAELDKIMKIVPPRKYEELRTLFNGIFKYAIASGLITHNPVAMIPFKRAERQNRDALSKGEILSLLNGIRDPKYERIRQATYLLYFFGLRPCEIDEETHREGDFLVTRNRKRKGGKIEYKKIPIPKASEGLIDWEKPLLFGVTAKIYYKWFEELIGDKTPYHLRHTFATICQQYVRPDIVDIWMGDSPQRLVGKVYTHFPDEFMKGQMDKVQFLLP